MKNILKTIISIPIGFLGLAFLFAAIAGLPEETRAVPTIGFVVCYLLVVCLNWHHTDWGQEREERRYQLELAKASAPVIKSDDRSQMSKLIGMLAKKKTDIIRGRCTHCGSSDIEIERV